MKKTQCNITQLSKRKRKKKISIQLFCVLALCTTCIFFICLKFICVSMCVNRYKSVRIKNTKSQCYFCAIVKKNNRVPAIRKEQNRENQNCFLAAFLIRNFSRSRYYNSLPHPSIAKLKLGETLSLDIFAIV